MRVVALVALLAGCTSPPPEPMWQDASVVGVVPEPGFGDASEARALIQSALDEELRLTPTNWVRVTEAGNALWHTGSDADREWMLSLHRGEGTHVHVGRRILNAALEAEVQRVVAERRYRIEPLAWDLDGEFPEGTDPELERARRLWQAIEGFAAPTPAETVAFSEARQEFDDAIVAVLRGQAVDPLRFVWGSRCGTNSQTLGVPRSQMGFLVAARAGDLGTATWWATRTGIGGAQGPWSLAWLDAVGAGWERAAAGAWVTRSGGYSANLQVHGGSEAAGWLRKLSAADVSRQRPGSTLTLLDPGKQPITEEEAELLLAETAQAIRLEADVDDAYFALRELNHYGDAERVIEAAERVQTSLDPELAQLARTILDRRSRWPDLDQAEPLLVEVVDASGRSTAGREVTVSGWSHRRRVDERLVVDEQGVVALPGNIVRDWEIQDLRLRIRECAGELTLEGDELLADRTTWTLGPGRIRIEGVEFPNAPIDLVSSEGERHRVYLEGAGEVCGLPAGVYVVERRGLVSVGEANRSRPIVVPSDRIPVVTLPERPDEKIPIQVLQQEL